MPPEEASSVDRASALHETLIALYELGRPDPEVLAATLEQVAPEDIAAVLRDLETEPMTEVFRAIPDAETQGTVLEDTDLQSRREILSALSEQERRRIIGEMPPDDLVDHLEHLPEAEQRRLIAGLGHEEAQDVEELLGYDPDTAGGMMTTEIVTIPLGSSSRHALELIQGTIDAEIINYVYVTEDGGFLRGVVSIRDILQSSPERKIDDYMETNVIKVHVNTDREEVAALSDRYSLQAVPVVDDFDRIRGIVTYDDIIEVVHEEHSEDMMRMAGTTSIHPLYEPLRVDVVRRLPFLFITMLGGIAVATVLDLFKRNILGVELFAAMVIWIHLVSALSGNVAVVTSTVMVRGLATGEVGKHRLRRAVLREFAVSILIAVTLAAGAAAIFWIYSELGERSLGAGHPYGTGPALLALSAAMLASLAWAGLVGGIVPVICRLTGRIDPAIASGPFVTITCDISASCIFLLFIWLIIGRPG